MGVSVEKIADNAISFREALDLGLELARESAIVPVDIDILAADSWAIITHNCSFIVRDDATDEPIGFLGMVEEQFGYSKQTALRSKHLYVKPEYRGAKGLGPSEALIGLFKAAREEAEKRNLMCFISVDNKEKNARRKGLCIEAQIVGFTPTAYVFQVR